MHLWTSADANKRALLRHLSIRDIFTGGGSFQRIARKLLARAAARGELCGYAAAQVAAFLSGGGGPDVRRDWLVNASAREDRLV